MHKYRDIRSFDVVLKRLRAIRKTQRLALIKDHKGWKEFLWLLLFSKIYQVDYPIAMRLFIAVDFSPECKEYITKIQKELYDTLEIKGTKVPKENFHITLEFLGEIERKEIPMISFAMDSINEKTFMLHLNGKIRSFKRGGAKERIYYLEIDRSESLEKIQWSLHNKLKDYGFCLEERAFKPHITLFRNAYTKEVLQDFPGFDESVAKISLMLSERVKGRMVYTPIYEKSLIIV